MRDVVRSVGRYMAEALGSDWEVRWATPEGMFERPYARVSASTPMQSTPIGAHHAELRAGVAVVAYPEVMADEEMSALEAWRVADVLWAAFAKGVGDGAPMRVPMLDYRLRAVDEPGVAPPRRSYMRIVEAPSISVVPDPAEPSAFIITVDVRVSWERATAEPPSGPVVERVTVGG